MEKKKINKFLPLTEDCSHTPNINNMINKFLPLTEDCSHTPNKTNASSKEIYQPDQWLIIRFFVIAGSNSVNIYHQVCLNRRKKAP